MMWRNCKFWFSKYILGHVWFINTTLKWYSLNYEWNVWGNINLNVKVGFQSHFLLLLWISTIGDRINVIAAACLVGYCLVSRIVRDNLPVFYLWFRGIRCVWSIIGELFPVVGEFLDFRRKRWYIASLSQVKLIIIWGLSPCVCGMYKSQECSV
jgi:hypothetical protein